MLVTFPSYDAFVFADVRCAARDRPIMGCGHLFSPPGSTVGQPAVVVMEGLGGLKESRELRYGRLLADWGYTALVVDSFGARRFAQTIDTWRALRVTTAMMLADAFSALHFLKEDLLVDPQAISIMGFSYGGMVSVLAAYEQIRNLFAQSCGDRFAGHVTYYGCSVPRLEDSTAAGGPVLMLMAEHDRNVSLSRTEQIVRDLVQGGADVALHVYENAYHQWDGSERKKRFVPFSLRDCRVRVDCESRLWDEKNCREIVGPWSQLCFFARNMNWHGYHMLQDTSVRDDSDARLFRFIARVVRNSLGPEAVTSRYGWYRHGRGS